MLAVLGLLAGTAYVPLQPPEMRFGSFLPICAALGALVGWKVLGPRTGRGWRASMEGGLAASVVLLVVALLLFATRQMFISALDGRYRGATEALVGIFGIILDYASVMGDARFIGTLVVGGIVAGLMAEAAQRRWG